MRSRDYVHPDLDPNVKFHLFDPKGGAVAGEWLGREWPANAEDGTR